MAVVGTTPSYIASSIFMVGAMMSESKRPKAMEGKRQKWHCLCMMEDGRELYLTIKATSASEASKKIHDPENGYKGVEYVLETITTIEMDKRKRYLKPSILKATQNF